MFVSLHTVCKMCGIWKYGNKKSGKIQMLLPIFFYLKWIILKFSNFKMIGLDSPIYFCVFLLYICICVFRPSSDLEGPLNNMHVVHGVWSSQNVYLVWECRHSKKAEVEVNHTIVNHTTGCTFLDTCLDLKTAATNTKIKKCTIALFLSDVRALEDRKSVV